MPASIRTLILSQQLEIAQICHVGGAAGGLQHYQATTLLTQRHGDATRTPGLI
jgi:hypothetical protein